MSRNFCKQEVALGVAKKVCLWDALRFLLFYPTILEGVFDYFCSGELGKEKRQRFSSPKPPSLSALAA
jgi:hypothetical protein